MFTFGPFGHLTRYTPFCNHGKVSDFLLVYFLAELLNKYENIYSDHSGLKTLTYTMFDGFFIRLFSFLKSDSRVCCIFYVF